MPFVFSLLQAQWNTIHGASRYYGVREAIRSSTWGHSKFQTFRIFAGDKETQVSHSVST